MKKSMKALVALLLGSAIILPLSVVAATENNPAQTASAENATTRSDAVIFKIHDVEPVLEDGIVKGCNYIVTLYNRTSINFRTFTLNLGWKDAVDERFKFERYVENLLGVEEAEKQRDLFAKKELVSKPAQTSVTVNAFGADKQISMRSYMDNEKCYLMLTDAEYTVTPCEIARNMNSVGKLELGEDKGCTELFQYVGPKNPEYFSEFKRISATEQAALDQMEQNSDLSDIDMVIGKIVENMGVSDKALTNMY